MTDKPRLKLKDIERLVIITRLRVFKNDKPAAAKSLGISLKGLYNKMHEYGIPL